MWTNSVNKWGIISLLFHWLMGLMIIGMLGVGLYMTQLPPSDFKWMLYGFHKSFGVIILILSFMRLVWRLSQTTPDLPELSRMHYLMAKASPWVLYILMFTMPISGYIMSVAGGHPVQLFDFWTLPNLMDKNPAVAGFAHTTHSVVGYLFVIVLILHVSAALYHHFCLKNFLLKRMLGKSG